MQRLNESRPVRIVGGRTRISARTHWRPAVAFRLLALLVGLSIAGCSNAVSSAQMPAPLPVAQDEAAQRAAASPAVEDLTFVDLNGVSHRLIGDAGRDRQAKSPPAEPAGPAVLIFLLPDCPIANSYAPELTRLAETFAAQGVRLLRVYVDPAMSDAAARRHGEQYRLGSPALVDRGHRWVQYCGATTAPEAVVLSPRGEVLYRGRIDDRYVGLGKRRAVTTSHDLREAVDGILASRAKAAGDAPWRPAPQPWPAATGCPIPELAEPASGE